MINNNFTNYFCPTCQMALFGNPDRVGLSDFYLICPLAGR
jgi:hypothetical protein